MEAMPLWQLRQKKATGKRWPVQKMSWMSLFWMMMTLKAQGKALLHRGKGDAPFPFHLPQHTRCTILPFLGPACLDCDCLGVRAYSPTSAPCRREERILSRTEQLLVHFLTSTVVSVRHCANVLYRYFIADTRSSRRDGQPDATCGHRGAGWGQGCGQLQLEQQR